MILLCIIQLLFVLLAGFCLYRTWKLIWAAYLRAWTDYNWSRNGAWTRWRKT